MSNLFQRSPQMTTPPKPRSLAWRRLSKHRPPKAKTLWSINPCLEASCNCSREKFAFSSLNSIQSNMFLRKTYLDCFLRLLSWALMILWQVGKRPKKLLKSAAWMRCVKRSWPKPDHCFRIMKNRQRNRLKDLRKNIRLRLRARPNSLHSENAASDSQQRFPFPQRK